MEGSVNIFISYAHEDKLLLERLEKHLALLRRQGLVMLWHDRDISAGTEWAHEIENHLNTAQIILLLISVDFLSSNYCYSIEMEQAMARHDTGDARVIPIILRSCDWKTAPFGKLQALPTNTDSVMGSHWHHLDEAFFNVATGIRKVVEELKVGKSQSLTTLPNALPFQGVTPNGLPRRRDFVGRDAEINKLMARLKVGETSGIYAINGMGGVGKTALAAEIVGRLLEEREMFPGGAVWIYCEALEGQSGLQAVWKQVARNLHLEQVMNITDPDIQRITLTSELANLPRLLLTLDNIEPGLDAEVLLNTLVVPNHTTVLLTARQVVVPEMVNSIMLRPLSEFSAAQLLMRRLKQVDDDRPTGDDEKRVPQIIDVLGGLPLALELVAAYAGIQHFPLTHILWELEQDRLQAASLNSDPRRVLRIRFNRSWAVLSSDEKQLFAGLSLLEGKVFQRRGANALAETLHQGKEDERLTSAKPFAKQIVSKLVAYALIEPIGQSYLRFHPLLREYAVEQLSQLASDPSQSLRKSAHQINLQLEQYPLDYNGLSAVEANNVWERHRKRRYDEWKQIIESTDVTDLVGIPSANGGAEPDQLLKLGIYLGEQGEWCLARKRILEGLESSKEIHDPSHMALCHGYLALLDELEENDPSALEHYMKALNFHLRNMKQIRLRLNSLQAKVNRGIAIPPQGKLRGFISIQQKKGIGDIYELRDKPLRIGRSKESDIVLEDPLMSRKHAIILPIIENDCSLKEEENSTNGIWLNDRLINKQQTYPLQSGDKIYIGDTILIFTRFDFLFLRYSVESF